MSQDASPADGAMSDAPDDVAPADAAAADVPDDFRPDATEVKDSLGGPDAPGCTGKASALVGYWKFDDGSGTTAHDSSCNGHSGMLVNNPIWDSGTLVFNGTNTLVAMGTKPALTGTGPIAVGAWINTTAAKLQHVVAQRSATVYNGEYVLYLSATGQASWFTYGDSLEGNNLNTTAIVNDGTWHHVVAVRETDGTGRLYVDGKLDISAAAPARTLVVTDVTVGADPRDSTNAFKGSIAKVFIHRRALSADEVAGIFGGADPPRD